MVFTNQRDYPNHFGYSLWWFIPPAWIWPAYLAMMVVLALFTVGLWTRITSILSLVVVISFVNRVPEALFGLDKLNTVLTIYLAIGPSGRALSIDRWLARRKKPGLPAAPGTSVGANFALRLIQVHMCIIYMFAGLSKLQGVAWWNGTAMWLAFGNLEYQSADMTWLAWHPMLVDFLTHFTTVWEISFCVLIWVPLLAAGPGHVGRHARGDRSLPGPVDVFDDHAGRLCIIFAPGRRRPGRRGPRFAVPAGKASNDGEVKTC